MNNDLIERIAEALERMAPAPISAPDLDVADAFVWHTMPDRLDPVQSVNRIDVDLLVGVVHTCTAGVEEPVDIPFSSSHQQVGID